MISSVAASIGLTSVAFHPQSEVWRLLSVDIAHDIDRVDDHGGAVQRDDRDQPIFK